MLFDGDDQLFISLASESTIYAEYGCGSSTQWMYCNTKSQIYTVDTSKDWSLRIGQELDDARVTVGYIDVGPVGDWGYPLSYEHRQRFRDYCDWPWQHNNDIDLILIDGRFRVACFLTCLKMAKPGTRILFDDYTNRPLYHVVEEWCRPSQYCGRQALFVVQSGSKFSVRDQHIAEFINVLG